MNKLYTSILESGNILALLREFNDEAERILAHLNDIQKECQSQQLETISLP